MLDKTECNLLVSALSSGGSRVSERGRNDQQVVAKHSMGSGDMIPPPPAGKYLICQKPGE